MNTDTKDLELILRDYQRFISTLLILSCYLYAGSVISTYIVPNEHKMVLIGLTIASIASAVWLLFRERKVRIELEKMDK